MDNRIATTKEKRQRVNDLLNKNLPHYRQAYSDRTSWLMACLSELAYIRFNPLFSSAQQHRLIENVTKLIGKNKESALITLIDSVAYDHEENKSELIKEIGTLNLKLIETFDREGTQAILVSGDKFAVLTFRGTEATSIKDIKSDIRAKLTTCETGGKIHIGFKEAFEKVEMDIQDRIEQDDIKNKPLFITGHSLGGALATVAAKKLDHAGGIAACYTFGSPRVGDDEWIAGMKTSLYRVVNAADGVTFLPPGATVISGSCWILKKIPYIGEPIRSWLAKFGGYLHCGDMRYLTNCPAGDYSKVKLLFHVSLFYRMKGYLVNQVPWRKFVKDHSIGVYSEKLLIVAEDRTSRDRV